MFKPETAALEAAYTCLSQGDFAQAEAHCQAQLKDHPQNSQALYLLGLSALQQDQTEHALEFFSAALHQGPPFAELFLMQSVAFQNQGQDEPALEAGLKALRLAPRHPRILSQLGQLYLSLGKPAEARYYYTLLLKYPDFPDTVFELATCALTERNWPLAAGYLGHFLTQCPGHPQAEAELCSALEKLGDGPALLHFLRQKLAATSEPSQQVAIHAALLRLLYYQGEPDPMAFQAQVDLWAQYFAPPAWEKTALRKKSHIHLGYYLSTQAQAHAWLPVLRHSSHQGFKISVYADFQLSWMPKGIAFQLTKAWSSQHLAQAIRQAEIDILVDLAGFDSPQRLDFWGLKAAPIQLGFGPWRRPGIDYALVTEETSPVFAEQTLPLKGLLPFPSPLSPASIVSDGIARSATSEDSIALSSSLSSRRLGLGVQLSLLALSPGLFQCMVEILQTLPEARLILEAPEFKDASVRQDVLGRFLKAELSPWQVLLLAPSPTEAPAAVFYSLVDLVLAPFPYHPAGPSLQALAWGRPVVALASAWGEGTAALRQNGWQAGLVDSPAAYTAQACQWALALQAGQGPHLQSPVWPLASDFGTELEQIYLQLWAEKIP